MKPAAFSSPLQQALTCHQAGRLDEAERLYRQLRATQPRCFEAWHHAGMIALVRGQAKEAHELLSRALPLQPRSADAHYHLALALRGLGRNAEAVRSFKICLQCDPRKIEAWHQLAVTLQHDGKLAEAAQTYAKGLEINPSHADSLNDLGALVCDTQGAAKALPFFTRATEVAPEQANGWCNHGLTLCQLKRYPEALASLDRALSLQPKLVKAHSGRALALQHLYRLREAAAAFQQALEVAPADSEAWSGRLLTLHYLDDSTPESLAAEHRLYGERMARALPAAPLAPRVLAAGERLRVGVLSSDLRQHAVATFFLPLVEQLDRSRFELFLYHDHAVADAVSRRFEQAADHWVHLAGQNHRVVENRIRQDRLDVLVDLCGHTGVNRLELFARRLAPTQINYLGYPNTTGLGTMDFRLTDAICDPEGEGTPWHSEKLVRFSACAWAFQPPADGPAAAHRTNDGRMRLGCFNNYAKVSDATLALWARVLARLPEARLCLKAQDLENREFIARVHARLTAAGIDPARVEFLGRTPDTRTHLEAYQTIDVSLDPLPYHGTTSTCEALWMGVPVVTLEGRAHVSRVSSSLLQTIGRAQWNCATEADYVDVVVQLVHSGTRSDEFRQGLRAAVTSSLLGDHAGQARRFGEALLRCHARA